MAFSNRDRVGRAIEILGEALDPFIARVLARVTPSGGDWTAILEAKDRVGGKSGQLYSRTDPQVQLRVITERLGELGFPFHDDLSRAEQNLAGELREVRNKWAHAQPFTADDTYRALDTTERLLRAVGAIAGADETRRLRTDLQRSAYENETRRSTKAQGSVLPSLEDAELTPWRQVLAPHPDVASGKYATSEFAADLYQVAHSSAEDHVPVEYLDPVEFFRRTYLTEGLRDLLGRAADRVTGDTNAEPVINLQTTFGGGKTHSLLAVWHLFSGKATSDLPEDVQHLLKGRDLDAIRASVRRVALVGNEISPGAPTTKSDGTVVRTLWGELAWQLGGANAFEMVAESDRTATNPGAALRTLLAAHSPAVILIDEWVAYARQLHGRDDLPGGSFETQFTFAQTLTEAAKSVPGVLLLVSVPASDIRLDDPDGASGASDLEVGGTHGRAALQRLDNVVRRVAHPWRAASSQESFEIVRRRLFSEPDGKALSEISATARRFGNFYREHSGEFPSDTRDHAYEARIKAAYPIHPELFDRLYEDWSTLERFQRTRGVLRLMSAVVHQLHVSGDDSALVMPGSIPLDAMGLRDEIAQYLDDSWKPIIDADIDGDDATSQRIDADRPLFGKRALTRRIARALFLGSAATLHSGHKGIERQRLFLGVAIPGDTVGNFGSSLQMLADRTTYLFSEGERYWFDVQPSINRMVTDRSEALDDEDVWAEVIKRLSMSTSGGAPEFAGVIVAPRSTGDVPEGDAVRLVVLHPKYRHHGKGADSPAWDFALDLARNRGTSPRVTANTVVMLAADDNRWGELDAAVRQHLAWRSIVASVEEMDLTQQNAAQARRRRDETNKIVDQRLSGTWIWGLYPVQAAGSDPLSISQIKSDGDDPRIAVRTGTRIVREDVLRTRTSPSSIWVELSQQLRARWNSGRLSVGELWEFYTRYPYLVRLKDKQVLLAALPSVLTDAGWTAQGFALATGYDESTGLFEGLALPLEDQSFGPLLDSTLLVAPALATSQREEERARAAAEAAASASASPGPSGGTAASTPTDPRVPGVIVNPTVISAARYEGRYVIDAVDGDVAARLQRIGAEVLAHLANAQGVELFEVTVEVRAEHPDGFSAATKRVVSENARTLRFDESRFEDVEF